MSLTEAITRFAQLGAEWVMWLLVVLSVMSVAIMIERGIVLRRKTRDADAVARAAHEGLSNGDVGALKDRMARDPSVAAVVLVAGLARIGDGPEAAEQAMLAAQTRERLAMDRRLVFLGTVGANAPFIGLAGTVLGVIEAFLGLGVNLQAGASGVVMVAIAEALAATFIGLVVAVPAVVAFNYFQRRIRATIAHSQIVAHALIGYLKAQRDAGSGKD